MISAAPNVPPYWGKLAIIKFQWLKKQRWMEMLINGEAKNITDFAAKLGLKPPYVTRVLGLNNLAPDIVEAIVNGAEPDGLSIAQIMKNIPEDWNEQRRLFGFPER